MMDWDATPVFRRAALCWAVHLLASRFKLCRVGRQVLLAAGDTFRAAAAEQLAGWAERAGAAIATASSARQRPDALLYSAVERVRAFSFECQP